MIPKTGFIVRSLGVSKAQILILRPNFMIISEEELLKLDLASIWKTIRILKKVILKNSMEMFMVDSQDKFITKMSLFLILAKIYHLNFRIMFRALNLILGIERM